MIKPPDLPINRVQYTGFDPYTNPSFEPGTVRIWAPVRVSSGFQAITPEVYLRSRRQLGGHSIGIPLQELNANARLSDRFPAAIACNSIPTHDSYALPGAGVLLKSSSTEISARMLLGISLLLITLIIDDGVTVTEH